MTSIIQWFKLLKSVKSLSYMFMLNSLPSLSSRTLRKYCVSMSYMWRCKSLQHLLEKLKTLVPELLVSGESILQSSVGAVVKTLSSHQCGWSNGSIQAQYQLWVEFVVGSHFAPGVFLWLLCFTHPPQQKPMSPNINSTRIVWHYKIVA